MYSETRTMWTFTFASCSSFWVKPRDNFSSLDGSLYAFAQRQRMLFNVDFTYSMRNHTGKWRKPKCDCDTFNTTALTSNYIQSALNRRKSRKTQLTNFDSIFRFFFLGSRMLAQLLVITSIANRTSLFEELAETEHWISFETSIYIQLEYVATSFGDNILPANIKSNRIYVTLQQELTLSWLNGCQHTQSKVCLLYSKLFIIQANSMLQSTEEVKKPVKCSTYL